MSLFAVILAVYLLIALHELGHLLVARAYGVAVLEFALGLGPALFRWQVRGIPCRLRLLPLGGYVQLAPSEAGADRAASTSSVVPSADASPGAAGGPARPSGRGMDNLAWHQRLVIFAAGPVFSIAGGALLLGLGIALRGDHATPFADWWHMMGRALSVILMIPARVAATLFAVRPEGGSVAGLQAVGHLVMRHPETAPLAEQVRLVGARMLDFLGFMSMALGAVNLLPMPPLDGGRIALEALGAVLPAWVTERLSVVTTLIGVVVILTLLASDVASDVWRGTSWVVHAIGPLAGR